MKKLYRQFKKIPKGLENQGYVEWKRNVLEEIKDYDEDKLVNMIKRYEILLFKSQKENDDSKLTNFVNGFISVFAMCLTATVSLSTVLFQKERMNQVVFISLFQSIIACLSVLIVYLAIIFVTEKLFAWLNMNKEIFYQEILYILKEKLNKNG